MIEFGKTLRAAREAKGLSIAQIAEATRMLTRVVENLENENFSDLPAPIYGRGFVKLYCEQVGLDPKPMVAEFMEIYNGARDIGIKEKPVAPAAPETAPVPPARAPQPPAPEPPAPEPLAADPLSHAYTRRGEQESVPQPDLFSSQSGQAYRTARPSPAPAQESPAGPQTQSPASSRFSRYASPVSDRYDAPSAFKWPSPAVWRTGVLVLAAIALIWALIAGICALYRATTGNEDPISDTTAAALTTSETAEPTAATAAAADNATRKPVAIPPLYLY